MTKQPLPRQHLRYSVAIPVPSLDRHGKKLKAPQIRTWTRKALAALTDLFGGATAIPAVGTNILNGRIVYEEGQVLVRSFCKNRQAFLAKRARVVSFAEEMGQALDQESVIVLASSSDSVLVELRLEDST
jgi:hypothetical protein